MNIILEMGGLVKVKKRGRPYVKGMAQNVYGIK